MPGHVLAQVALDLGLAHAGEEIPGTVIGAHVLQAEMMEFAQTLARLGRAIVAAELAARPVAQAPGAVGVQRIEFGMT